MSVDPYRRVALRLHALHAADRDWMLRQLDADIRARLAGLLGELRSLGIPADPALLEEFSSGASAPPSAADDIREQAGAAVDALCAADFAAVAALLADEAELAVAALLAAYPWPWQARMLESCDPERRRRLVSLAHDVAGMSVAARAALVAQAAGRLARLPSKAAAGATPPAVPFWKRRLSWRR